MPRQLEDPAYFTAATAMTDPGPRRDRFDSLPTDLATLASLPQGLAVHLFMAKAYGLEVTPEREHEAHIRPVEALLDRIVALDDRPLGHARPPERRVIGSCHHFMLLLTAMLRAKGVPARARCGFASYFNPGYYEDHWITEAWFVDERRWLRIDPEIDDVHRDKLSIDFDALDVPPDRFLTAGEAWMRCREGNADPMKFGVHHGEKRGLWFIAGDLVRDLAALNKVEVLPWDAWGKMPAQDGELTAQQLAWYDEIARVTTAGDRKARADLFARDELHPGERVRNVLRGREEPLFGTSL